MSETGGPGNPSDLPLVLRRATLEDAEGIASAHVRYWQTTYAGIVAPEFLSSLRVSPRHEHWSRVLGSPPPPWVHVLVESTGRVLGFASAGPERSADPVYDGEIYTLYLDPKVQGKGIGRALVEALVADMRGSGIEAMLVWVMEESTARRFFEHLGGAQLRSQVEMLAGQAHRLIAYGWRRLDTSFPRPGLAPSSASDR